MSMTDQQLHDAISADATAKALADAGNDSGCAARMSAVLPAVSAQYVPVRTLIYWGALTGARAKMQVASNDNASPVQSLAISYMDLIRDSNSPGLDVTDPNIIGTGGMLDAFVATTILTASGAGSKADLIAQAPTSPAVVPVDQVSRAWLQHRPNGKVAS